MNKSKITLFISTPSLIGEGALWHPVEKKLYWVDIAKGELYRSSFEGKDVEVVISLKNRMIGGFTFQKGGGLLLFLSEGEVLFFDGESFFEVLPPNPNLINDRFNDVIASPDGSIFCGTMPSKKGGDAKLFHLSKEGVLTLVEDGFKLANGMGFSCDKSVLYFADTRDFKIYSYRYKNEKLSKREEFIDFHNREGRPDGLTVDNQDNLWVAETGASQIAVFNSKGVEIESYSIKGAKKPTTATFGGDNLNTLFITSLGGDDRGNNGEEAGSLFSLNNTFYRGKEEFFSTIQVGKKKVRGI